MPIGESSNLISVMRELIDELRQARIVRDEMVAIMNSGIQAHTNWINKVLADQANRLQAQLGENQKWIDSRMTEWAEGERQKIQREQIAATERIASAMEKETALHEETHREMRGADAWKYKRKDSDE